MLALPPPCHRPSTEQSVCLGFPRCLSPSLCPSPRVPAPAPTSVPQKVSVVSQSALAHAVDDVPRCLPGAPASSLGGFQNRTDGVAQAVAPHLPFVGLEERAEEYDRLAREPIGEAR